MKRTRFTARVRDKFLEALAKSGIVSDACRKAGISRVAAYEHRNAEPDFAAAWDDAEKIAADALEAEARRRAEKGCERFVVSKGQVVLHPVTGKPLKIREYSDTLMALLLKARKPEEFGDRSRVEHSGPGGGPISFSIDADYAKGVAEKLRAGHE